MLRCPLPDHVDSDPSATANARKRVWLCHRCGGGTLTDLAARLGLDPPRWHDRTPAEAQAETQAETVYRYQDASGDSVFEVVRRETTSSKRFLQRHQPEPGGTWVWKVPLAGKGLIYRLPDVLRAVQAGKPVLVTEGEKDADRLTAMGFAVTCNAGGAGKWTRSHAQHLPRGTKVYVLPDCDAPGVTHADKVGRALLSQGCEVYQVAPSVLGYALESSHGRDVSDWLNDDPSRGHAEVEALLHAADPVRQQEKAPRAAESPVVPPPAPGDTRPTILCARGRRGEWTREAVRALVESGPRDDRRSLYGGVRFKSGSGSTTGDVVVLATAPPPEPDAGLRVPEGALRIVPVTDLGICRRLDREARWLVARRNRASADTMEPSDPTENDAKHVLETYRDDLLDTDTRPRLRTLRGVVDAPTIRRDGTLIHRPGYDEKTWLYADFDPRDWRGLPEHPTRDDARKALGLLYDLVAETPFAEPTHRAVWVSLVLSLVGRPFIGGNVPLHAFTANAPGIGKGTLVDLASIIATGRLAAKWAPVSGRKADAETEERKRLMAIALAGIRLVCIDNIKAGDPLGTPALDGALTTGSDNRLSTISDRVLGESAVTEAPWSCVVTATGNNLTVVGDMARRTLLSKLVTSNPSPETLVYKHHPGVVDYCIDNRDKLLVAALTVLIAYRDALARDEAQPLPRIASYGGWSDHIRSPIAWADPDGCDPWESNAEVKAGAQPEQAEALAFLAAWHAAFRTREVVVRDIDRLCQEHTEDYSADLAEAVRNLSLARPRGKASVNTQHLGRWLSAHKDRPGEFVLREGKRQSGKPMRWYVEAPSLTSRDQAIRCLALGYIPVNVLKHVVGDEALIEFLKELSDEQLLALQDLCGDGRRLSEKAQAEVQKQINTTCINLTTGQVFDGEGFLKHLKPELTAEERAHALFHRAIDYLALEARYGQVGSPLSWREDLEWDMKHIALGAVEMAVRQLGPEADAESVEWKAVNLMNDHLDPMTKEEREGYNAEHIEEAIKRIVGFLDYPRGILERMKEGRRPIVFLASD